MNHLKYIIFMMAVLIYSCAEDLGNYDYKELNDITISGLPEDTIVQVLTPFYLEPKLDQALFSDESDLEFVWRTGIHDTISRERNLDITFPADVTYGSQTCYYIVTDKTTGVRYHYKFNLTLTSIFSFGYYVLSEKEDHSSLISFLKTGDNKWIHTNKVGSVSLGNLPRQMKANWGMGWEIYIVTEEGEFPVIKTNSINFLPNYLIGSGLYMGNTNAEFAPTSIVPYNGMYFTTANGIEIYNKGVLYPPATGHNYDLIAAGKYEWQSKTQLCSIWAFDNLSRKFYLFSSTEGQSDYIYDNVSELTFTTPISYDNYDGVLRAVCNGGSAPDWKSYWEATQVVAYNSSGIDIINDGYVQAVDENWQPAGDPEPYRDIYHLPVSGANENSFCANFKVDLTGVNDDDNLYFAIGNSVYLSPPLNPELIKIADIPSEYGIPLKLGKSDKFRSKLWIATYDENSSEELKGSVLAVNKNTGEIEETYKNVCGKPVTILAIESP